MPGSRWPNHSTRTAANVNYITIIQYRHLLSIYIVVFTTIMTGAMILRRMPIIFGFSYRPTPI